MVLARCAQGPALPAILLGGARLAFCVRNHSRTVWAPKTLAVFRLKIVPHLLTVGSDAVAQPMQPPVLQVFQVSLACVRKGIGRVRQSTNVSLSDVERNKLVAWAGNDGVAALDGRLVEQPQD